MAIGFAVGSRLLARRTSLNQFQRRAFSCLKSNLNTREPFSEVPPIPISINTLEQLRVGKTLLHPVLLRDSCPCPRCIDPSTKQKTFNTTDIPTKIRAKSVQTQPNGDVEITWKRDIAGFEFDHVSIFPKKHFITTRDHTNASDNHSPQTWDKRMIAKGLEYVNYADYMSKDESLFKALLSLQLFGIVVIQGMDDAGEQAVEKLASRIGTIRDTFYGRTWDVKSIADAKNVAYTQQFLGLHQDLLYMQDPPGFQFLHCIKNSMEGGASLFSDSFHAFPDLSIADQDILSKYRISYQYRNDGQHYYASHPVVEMSGNPGQLKSSYPKAINYSPPFQANFPCKVTSPSNKFLSAFRKFAAQAEAPKNLFEYKLMAGETVIFNNRRILHGRGKFDGEKEERWLKGTYIDTDVFMSKFRVLNEQFDGKQIEFGEEAQTTDEWKRFKYMQMHDGEGEGGGQEAI